MIIGYITKDREREYANVESRMVQVKPGGVQRQRHYFVDGVRLKTGTLSGFINKCDACEEVTVVGTNYATKKINDGHKLCCSSCVNKGLFLSPEERIARNERRLRKQEKTKKQNGTRPGDLVKRGKKFGFMNFDQSKGSEIRRKMDETKKQNGTWDQSKGSEIRRKMDETKKQNGTTQDQVRSGWLGWSEEKRREFIDSRPGFLQWTEDERLEHNRKQLDKIRKDPSIRKKIRQTKEKKGLWVPLENKSSYDLYRREVWYYTNLNNLDSLPNYHKRGRVDLESDGFHLDHRYSISEGFKNNVDPKIIGSIHNLEMIHNLENSRKGGKCSISLEELIAAYENENDTNTALSSVK